MSTAIETLPGRHRVSWRNWIIALAAFAMLSAALGSYLALRGGAASPTIAPTAKPSVAVAPERNLQPVATPQGSVIKEMRDVGGIPGYPTSAPQPTSGSDLKATTSSSTGHNGQPSSGSPPDCLSNVAGGPC
jgi:hypothetical protein